MRYDEQDRRSSNVEDRRSQGRRGGFRFPGGFGMPGGRGRPMRIPIGGRSGFSLTTLLIIGVIMFFLGINPLEIFSLSFLLLSM